MIFKKKKNKVSRLAAIEREMADWLRANHYNKFF